MNLFARSLTALTTSFALCAVPALALADEEKHLGDAHSEAKMEAKEAKMEAKEDKMEAKEDQLADKKDAKEQITESTQVLKQMSEDPEVKELLSQSKGVFVMPDYATAALIIGGEGGEGVLLSQREGEWGNPAFYDVGAISAGLQAGVAAGSITLILMTDKAVDAFKEESNFSLSSAAGLSVINYSARAQGEIGEGNDVIAWTDTEGLFGELSVGISNINWDEEENQAYYGQPTTPEQVISGTVTAEDPSEELSQVVPR